MPKLSTLELSKLMFDEIIHLEVYMSKEVGFHSTYLLAFELYKLATLHNLAESIPEIMGHEAVLAFRSVESK